MIPSILPRSYRLLPGLLALGLALGAAAPAAHAQLAKAFVASTGSDANGTGARNAPLRTFNAAQAAIGAGGEIVVLDTAGFGAFTITKSLTVTVPPGVNAFVTVSSGSGINVAAGAGDVVTLRGLIVEGGGGSDTSGNGINCTSVGTLRLDNCTVRNFINAVTFTNANAATLVLNACSLRDSTTGMDIEANGNPVNAVLNDTILDGFGLSGIYATGSSANVVTLTRCTINNADSAVYSSNATTSFVLNACTISGSRNTAAVSASSGALISKGNNTFSNNASDGDAFTASPLK